MKKSFIVLILLILSGCKLKEEKLTETKKQIFDSSKIVAKNNIDSAFESKIIDSVFKLKKIRSLNEYYDSISNHKAGVAILISKRPASDTDFYVINVGHDAEGRFISIYNFHAYKKTFEIKYDDPVTGRLIEIEKWNKMK